MISYFFVSRFEVPKRVTGGDAVARNTLFAEVFVEVREPGCYTLDLVLKDRELTGADVLIASQEVTTRQCFCFAKPFSRRRFFVYGAADEPKGVMVAKPTPGTSDIPSDMLPPLSGKWPTDDGRFSSDLELFVEASIYRCRPERVCRGDESCGTASDASLVNPLVTRTSDQIVVDIKGGKPFRPLDAGAGVLEKAGSALIPKLFSDAGTGSDPTGRALAAGLAERRLARLERKLAQRLVPPPDSASALSLVTAVAPPEDQG